MAPWDEVGGGGGMLGGVDRGCVFTSAGESGIAAAFSFLLAKERERKKQIKQLRAEQAGQHLGRGLSFPWPGGLLIPTSPSVLTGGWHPSTGEAKSQARWARRG